MPDYGAEIHRASALTSRLSLEYGVSIKPDNPGDNKQFYFRQGRGGNRVHRQEHSRAGTEVKAGAERPSVQ
jgi:hypothetical protein